MTGLLCRLGIHRPEWAPIPTVTNGSFTTSAWVASWLKVRQCRDCAKPLERRHR